MSSARLAGLGLRPSIALEIDGVPAILDLVAEGMGSAVLPRNAASNTVRPSAYALRRSLTRRCVRASRWPPARSALDADAAGGGPAAGRAVREPVQASQPSS